MSWRELKAQRPYLEKRCLPYTADKQNLETGLSLLISTKGQNVEKYKDASEETFSSAQSLGLQLGPSKRTK